MSQGAVREDRIMVPLRGLPTKHYNRIYAAVWTLSDATAIKLVATIKELWTGLEPNEEPPAPPARRRSAMASRLKVGDIVIRCGYSDHFRGKIIESLPGQRALVRWQDGRDTVEQKPLFEPMPEPGDLLRIVGAPDPTGERDGE